MENVLHIFGLPLDGEVVTVWTNSSKDFLRQTTWESVQQYVRCHIFCLLGTTLFTDKSTAYAHAKYLPLLQFFSRSAIRVESTSL
ncbi:hypothetical protein AHAS_Ahas10G0106800 [Arachis hypogaea]